MKKPQFEPKCISLFSGGGGLDLGLEAAGFDTIFASDIDPYSCATLQKGGREALRRNLPFLHNATIHCGDVNNLEGNFIRAATGLGRDSFDLLAGGPPCQAFSVFGNRKGTKDPRGMLVFEYIRILADLKPKAFVFENVYGLLTVEGGEVFKKTLDALAKPASNLRYKITVMRLNSADYGVPQFRDRIFVIGSREGKEVATPPVLTNSLGVNGCYPYRTVEMALRGMPELGSKYPANHYGRTHSSRIIKRYDDMVFGERDSHTRINRLDPKRPSYTIIVGSDKGGGKGHIHPYLPREVSPRESARIQTFPDWWEFVGTVRHPIRQIGNAVPSLLGYAVGSAIMKSIFAIEPRPLKEAIKLLEQEHLFTELYED
jgi:DNA (cytosine-5)-methyltransferase 1